MPVSQEKRNAIINNRRNQKPLLEAYLQITDEIIAGKPESQACLDHHIPVMTYRYFMDKTLGKEQNTKTPHNLCNDNSVGTVQDRFMFELLGPNAYVRDDFWTAYDITTQAVCTIKEKQAIDMRTKEDLTLQEIAGQMNVTTERTRQVIQKVMRKLRAPKYRMYFEQGVKEAMAAEEIERLKHDYTTKRCEYVIARQKLNECMEDTKLLTRFYDTLQHTANQQVMDRDEYLKLTMQFAEIQRSLTHNSDYNQTTDVKQMPIEDLGLSTRSYNILKRANIDTFGQLLRLTETELRALRWAGERSCMEILSKVQSFGYKLKIA